MTTHTIEFEITLKGRTLTEYPTKEAALENFLEWFDEVSWPATTEITDWDVGEPIPEE